MSTDKRRSARTRRHARLRTRVRGTAERPRLAVYRSNAGVYAQVIDDHAGHTVAAASSLDGDVQPAGDAKLGVAAGVGRLVAERATAAGVTKVVFDRGGNAYAGRVRALADAAREAGLDF